MIIYVLAGLGMIAFLAAFAAILVSVVMARRKVVKEIGYLKRHLRYHPARADQIYKIDGEAPKEQ